MLTVGTLEPRKDHATLLEAIGHGSCFPPLVIAGAVGWNSRGILRLVRKAENDGRARYLGRVSDEELAVLYRAARVMIYPSLYEGFGLPVLEAMASGCPVLCSWSSSLPEVGGRAACYFRAHDAHDLANKLGELLPDNRRLAEMKARGIEQAAKFSFSSAAEQTLGVLHGSAQVR
jgi:alpha-1,3-rhamnosyl/mannosyltransferase